MIRSSLFCLLFLFASCSRRENNPEKEVPTALCTISPYPSLISQIAGAAIKVETLIPPGVNMHAWEPSPKEVEQASKALIWFQIREPIEHKLEKSLKEKNPNILLVDLQQSIPLMGDEATDLSPPCGHAHDGLDLHTWMNPLHVASQVNSIYRSLSSLLSDPNGAMKTRAKELTDSLQELDRKTQASLAPYKGQAILASHPAFGYFCQKYELVQLAVECEGKDPRPQDLSSLLKKASQFNIRVVLIQQGFDNRGARLIAKHLNIPIVEIDTFDPDYPRMIQTLTEAIIQ